MRNAAMFPDVNTGAGTIDFSIEGAVANIRLNWPAKRNAMRFAMWSEFPGVLDAIQGDPSVAVVVVSGAGDQAFASGADINELKSCLESPEKAAAYMAAAEAATEAIASCRLPMIAAIRGFCIGAGLEIAMACDFRLATSASSFGAPPAKLGANYSFASTKRLVDLVGTSTARKLLYTGLRMSAPQAASAGLVDYCGDEMERELKWFVDTLASNSPYSIRVAKQTLNEIQRGAFVESDSVKELRLNGFMHQDFREGIASFFEKRPPQFRRDAPHKRK